MSGVKVCPQCAQEFGADTLFCPRDGSALLGRAAGANLVGRVVADRYLVQREIGHGGMGVVYLAEHVRMGRPCAFKVIKPELVASADAAIRFNREAANASRIVHPNVVQVYDSGETDEGLIYFAMEYVDGVSLTALVKAEGALPPRRAASIALQVADALAAAHDLRMVHRDLKPDNIMLAKHRGGGDQVKVVDFGVSRIMDSAAQKLTSSGLIVGTPDYMSPEQFSGDEVDGRSDLYSLGIVLHFMLTGTLPFTAATPMEAMAKRMQSKPARLADAAPGRAWPESLQRVIDTALAPDPAKRFATAAAFGTALSAAIEAWIPDNPQGKNAWDNTLRFGPSRQSDERRAIGDERRAAGGGRSGKGVWILVAAVVVIAGAYAARGRMGNRAAVPPDSARGAVRTDAGSAAVNPPAAAPAISTPDPVVAPPKEETAEVLGALAQVKALTVSGSTPADATTALSLLATLAPQTRMGRVEKNFRALEANVILDHTTEICRLIPQLRVEAKGTRFERGVDSYAGVAKTECR